MCGQRAWKIDPFRPSHGASPHYAGINTFLKAPYVENVRDAGKYEAAILGAPFASGRRVAGRADFFIGVADTPLDPAPSWTPVSLRNKIAAGAQFAQTQFCTDGAITRRYMNRLAEEGITERLFVLIGIASLLSARTALWMREHLPGSIIPDALINRLARAGHPKAEGKRICIELLQELSHIPAVSGAHIMAPRNHSAIAEVIAEARSAGISRQLVRSVSARRV